MTISFEFAPIPKFFKDNGYYKDPFVRQFVAWAFERCNVKSHFVTINHKDIQLDAFEFVFGRESCMQETGIPAQRIRTILANFINQQILVKSTSKSSNKFTVYKWVTERFCKTEKQQSTSRFLGNQPQIREYINNNINIVISPTALPIQNSFVMNLPTNSKIVPINVMFQKPQNLPESKQIPSASIETIKSPEKLKPEKIKPKRCVVYIFDRKTNSFSNIDKKLMDYWSKLYPDLNIHSELEKFRVYLLANPTKKGFVYPTQSCFTKWLGRSMRWKLEKLEKEDPELFRLKTRVETVSREEAWNSLDDEQKAQYEKLYKYN